MAGTFNDELWHLCLIVSVISVYAAGFSLRTFAKKIDKIREMAALSLNVQLQRTEDTLTIICEEEEDFSQYYLPLFPHWLNRSKCG